MHVSQFHVKNQFTVTDDEGNTFFQSYHSVIVKKANDGKIYLDRETWDYSKTTGRYRNLFLRETKAETEKKIKTGEYILTDLN